MKNKKAPPVVHAPVVYPRSDPAELAKFDPRTKVCTMNCGQAVGDPRSWQECRFQCGDCLDVEVPPEPHDVLLIEEDAVVKLRSIARALNDPTVKVDWDKRRDLANLLDQVLMGAPRLKEGEF